MVALSSKNHVKALLGVFLRRLEDLPQFISSKSRRLVDEVYSSEVYFPEVSNEVFLNVMKNGAVFLIIYIFLLVSIVSEFFSIFDPSSILKHQFFFRHFRLVILQ